MAKLQWRSAGKHHRQGLSEFVCTDPPKRDYDRYRGKHHPRPWEMEVQSYLRGLRTPVNDGELLAVGTDGQGIAAAVHLGFDVTEKQFIIWAVARAQRCAGLGYGREALEVALASVSATKRFFDVDCGVFTHVDPRNAASQSMLKALGFEFLDVYEGYEGWVRDL